jgi:DNA-binding NtrC family response regulator
LKQAREEIAANPPDILLVDLRLPDGSGLDLLAGLEPTTAPEVVLITGDASVETAVDALRRGAIDYLTKPVDFARIKMALGNVTRTLEMKGEIGALRGELRKLGRFGPLIGTSPAMQTVYDLVSRVARTDASVLINGETGTGKDVVALTIHSLSRRSKEAFLPVNCGAISANLIESELFGHERGSFTGADRSHKGSGCCACWSRPPSPAWEETSRSGSTCASSPPRASGPGRRWRRASCGRTCSTA